MKTHLHLIGGLVLVALCPPGSNAQIVFSATNLPSQIGQYYRAYANTNVNVSSLLGQSGGPRRWDFSQARNPNEVVKRMDIVAVNDSGHGAGFAQAAYAERLTQEINGPQSWMYFRIVTGPGRNYYGFYDAVANPLYPAKVFSAPTVDLPSPIQFGQSWTRTVDFDDYVDAAIFQIQFAIHFTAQAQVDAYGTIVLPGIGEVPTLRVNEIHTYESTDLTYGLFDSVTYFRNYYWLVRGMGKAVDILSDAQAAVPPIGLVTAAHVLRVFEASNVTDLQMPSVADLRIQLQSGQAILNWQQNTNASGYRVELLRNRATNDWQLLSEPTSNSWSEAVITTEPQRLFRVLTKP